MRRSHMFAVMCVFVTSVLLTNSSYATKMLHRNAEELAKMADRIFVGVCTSVAERRDGNMIYTEYTFQVLQNIKGVGSGTLVLRQFGRARGVGSVIGMPAYDQGQKYMLFLRSDSEYGLASPIGLGQGAFRIIESDGSEQAINAFGNSGLFHRMDAKSAKYSTTLSSIEKSLMATTTEPVDFNNFVGLMQKLVK